jgi:hypothetical protein
VALNLPPPAGYCELSEAQPSDAGMITAIGAMLDKGGNRLLVISAECRQLDDWQAGRRPLLANYAQYQTLKTWENSNLPAAPAEVIKGTCAQLRAQGEGLTTNMTPDVQRRFDEVMKTVKINEMKFLGVLDEGSTIPATQLCCSGYGCQPAQISRRPLCSPPPSSRASSCTITCSHPT